MTTAEKKELLQDLLRIKTVLSATANREFHESQEILQQDLQQKRQQLDESNLVLEADNDRLESLLEETNHVISGMHEV